MTTNDEYNGWTNRETWAVHLWLSNEEPLYNYARKLACADYNYKYETDDAFSDFVDELLTPGSEWMVPETEQHTMQRDIGSLWRVNWREVANAFHED